MTQGLHRALQQTPTAPLTIYGDRMRTVAEFVQRVARAAGALRSLGAADDDRVAILSLNSDRFAELLAAVPWANAVLVPVNIRWSPAEIAYSLEESETAIIAVDDAFAPMLPGLREACPRLRTAIHIGDGATSDGMLAYEELLSAADPIEDARRRGDSLAGIFYTGGTTGVPKGAMLSHANLLTSALGTQATLEFLTPGGRFLHAAPMFHLADLTVWNVGTLIGGTHVFIPGFEPTAVLKAIETHRVTDLLLVPTMIQLVVDHPDIGRYDLSSVTHLVFGASPISEAVLERAAAALPGVTFVQAYGMTELSPIATMLSGEDQRTRLRSAGRAALHAEVRIVDAEGREVPRGTVGEIAVSGANVMLGYLNKPEETAAAVRDGWMYTGDGAFMDEEGFIYIVDRVKDMIISGGENVYSAEVENAVATHPAVAACAVIGVPDATWGERVHAVVVLHDGAAATAEELCEHVKGLIAGYKAPRSAEFVDALPVSSTGKVLKRELREKFWRGVERQVS